MTANLLSRLEGLTAPDREVDALIYDRFNPPTHNASWPFSPGSKLDHRVPRFTASLDAAVALCERVLPGWQWAAWGGAIEAGSTKPRCMARVSDGRQQWANVDTPTPAIALLIAILTALGAREDE